MIRIATGAATPHKHWLFVKVLYIESPRAYHILQWVSLHNLSPQGSIIRMRCADVRARQIFHNAVSEPAGSIVGSTTPTRNKIDFKLE